MEPSQALNAGPRSDAILSVVIGAGAVAGAGILSLALVRLGPISGHMALHIGSMSVVAPFAAMALVHRHGSYLAAVGGKELWLATLVQIGLLWASHSPPIHHVAHASAVGFSALHAALFLAAVAFWTSVMVATARWQTMFALLLSAKLACLLGALLIFSPRVLLAAPPAHDHHALTLSAALADQQLAGLLMIAACPLSYVLTAIVLAAKTVTGFERVPAPAFQALRR